MRRISYHITLLLLILIPLSTYAQKPVKANQKERLKLDTLNLEIALTDTLTNEYLDTVIVDKKGKINDYTLIGVQYGVGLSQVMWNPSQKQQMIIMPYNFGVTFTKYGKMFGYMPFFGFQAGIFYGQEGYQFKLNEDTGYTYSIQGADKAVFDVIEVPVLSHIHIDFWKMKIIANIGFYGGYRLKVKRFPIDGKFTDPEFEKTQNSFLETDRRFDYGIKGGLGFGFIFDPVEIHITAMYKHSLSSLYQPDYYSKYYYRYAYPSNIIISAGVHFQLSKRTGKTRKELKEEARNIVYEIGYSESK
jgi:hypothetical protein